MRSALITASVYLGAFLILLAALTGVLGLWPRMWASLIG